MTFRITKQRLQNRFETLARKMGWDVDGPAWVDGAATASRKSKIGYTFLEHNTVYGYSVNRIVNERGGESRIKESCSAAEMDAWLGGAIFAAYEMPAPPKPRILIEVSGGVADVTEGADLADIEIIDHDNLEEDAA